MTGGNPTPMVAQMMWKSGLRFIRERAGKMLPLNPSHRLTEYIDLSQIDDFVTVPTKQCFEHEEAETGHLIEADLGRNHEYSQGRPTFCILGSHHASKALAARNSTLSSIVVITKNKGTFCSPTIVSVKI